MKLTERGKQVTTVLLFSLVLSTLSPDPLMQTTSITLLLVLMLDSLSLYLRLRNIKGIKASPESLLLRAETGEVVRRKIMINKPVGTISSNVKWIKFKTIKLDNTGSELVLEASSKLGGKYELKNIIAHVVSLLGLFKETVDIRLNVTLKVYPKSLPLIMGALLFLQGSRGLGPGLFHGKRRGQGVEYAETREYVPGDPLKFIDWKATARLSKLMVKEFLEERYGAPHIIFNGQALGPLSADELSFLLLSTVLGLASEGLPMGFTFKTREKTTVVENVSPRDAVKMALLHVLETYPSLEWEIYELVEPRIKRESLIKFLKGLREGSLRDMYVKGGIGSQGREGPVIYIGIPAYNASSLLSLSEKVRINGLKLYVLTPEKPWRDLNDLEEAYALYTSHYKTIRALQKMGAEVRTPGNSLINQ